MRGLTLYQPWASLIACGAKQIETRSWATSYRGLLAIHAGANKTYAAQRCGDPLFRDALGGVSPFDLPRGAIVAVATLADCRTIWPEITEYGAHLPDYDQIWMLTDQERAFGDYAPGRYAWLLSDVRPLREPIPCKGALGLWIVPDELAAQIEASIITTE